MSFTNRFNLLFFRLRQTMVLLGCAIATANSQAAETTPIQPVQETPFVVQLPQQGAWHSYEGRVEAVRRTQVAAQVAGTLVALKAKVGDKVQTGQLLARIDARSIRQGVAANQAQLRAAQAALDLADSELARQQRLFEKRFISQAALEHARAEHRAAKAKVEAQQAQVDESNTREDFHAIHAPYDGVLAAVNIELGDMLMPGRNLFELYDPADLRVSADLPQSVAARLNTAAVRISLQGGAPQQTDIQPVRVQILPTVDTASLTRQVRADLPANTPHAVPGMFARLRVNAPVANHAGTLAQSPLIPAHLLVRRAEMTGLYVLDGQQRPLLRQVRVGQQIGDEIEIISGLSVGDRVVPAPRPSQP